MVPPIYVRPWLQDPILGRELIVSEDLEEGEAGRVPSDVEQTGFVRPTGSWKKASNQRWTWTIIYRKDVTHVFVYQMVFIGIYWIHIFFSLQVQGLGELKKQELIKVPPELCIPADPQDFFCCETWGIQLPPTWVKMTIRTTILLGGLNSLRHVCCVFCSILELR